MLIKYKIKALEVYYLSLKCETKARSQQINLSWIDLKIGSSLNYYSLGLCVF